MKALLYPYCTSVHGVTSLIFHIYKTSWAFEHSDSFSGSSGSHSQLVSCSVGITSSCSLLAFPLTVSLTSSRLRYLCSPVSQTCNCARLLTVATPVLKAAVKSTKVKLPDHYAIGMHCTSQARRQPPSCYCLQKLEDRGAPV